MLTQEHIAAIEEAAQAYESAAKYNREMGRTVFAHSQQEKADKLKEIVTLARRAAPEAMDARQSVNPAADEQALLRRAADFISNTMYQSMGQAGRGEKLAAEIRAAIAHPIDQAAAPFAHISRGTEEEQLRSIDYAAALQEIAEPACHAAADELFEEMVEAGYTALAEHSDAWRGDPEASPASGRKSFAAALRAALALYAAPVAVSPSDAAGKACNGCCGDPENCPVDYRYCPHGGILPEKEEAVAASAGRLPNQWENDVRTAWRCVRKYNNTIPDETLDLMRDMLLAASQSPATSAANSNISDDLIDQIVAICWSRDLPMQEYFRKVVRKALKTQNNQT
jgi:hypothetical protein